MSDVHGRYSGAVNFTMGAVTEGAKQLGVKSAQNAAVGGTMNKMGHKAVAAGAALAIANPVGAAVVGVAVVGLGCYWLVKKISDA